MFSFGCSWTNFIWPTYADIIAWDLELPFENWGKMGCGNQAIQSRLAECDMINNITKDDLVLLQWSSWTREDRYLNGQWHCGGNLLNNSFYTDDFIERYWSWENDVIRNSTIIHTTQKAYKDIITYEMSMTAFPGMTNNTDILPWLSKVKNKLYPNHNKVENFYKSHVHMPPCFSFTNNSQYNGKCKDQHPDILCHLRVVQNQIYPNLGLQLKQTTIDQCHAVFNALAKIYLYDDTYDVMVQKTKITLSQLKINIGPMLHIRGL
jgi:hypothetical protein